MRVVALLSAELLSRLIDAVGDAHGVHVATNPGDVHRLLRGGDAGVLIVDPTVSNGSFMDEIERAVVEFSLPTIVYTRVTARAMSLVLRLASSGVHHMVLYGNDDEPCQIREVIERAPSSPVADLVLRELRGAMSSLPPSVIRAIEQVFHAPSGVRTGADLARLARMTRRSLYRHMAMASLRPRDVIDCARVCRAYALLRTSGSRLKDTSTSLGFANPRTLSDLIRVWTGQTTRSLHHDVSPDDFVRLLAANILRSGQRVRAVTVSAV